VAFDHVRSVADVWIKAMVRGPWKGNDNKMKKGWAQWRPMPGSAELFMGEIPFTNPFMDPTYEGPFFTPRAAEVEMPF
jgi:hypothetical protein